MVRNNDIELSDQGLISEVSVVSTSLAFSRINNGSEVVSGFAFVGVGSLISANWIVIRETSVMDAFSRNELSNEISITKGETFIDKSVSVSGTNEGSSGCCNSNKSIVTNLAISVCSLKGGDRQKEK